MVNRHQPSLYKSVSNLRRKTFVRPDILELGTDEIIQVVKQLHGLSDAGDYWGEKLKDHHRKKLYMEQTTGDFSLFFTRTLNKIIGLSGTYVDYIIRAGKKDFKNKSTAITGTNFDSKPIEYIPFTFTEIKLSGSLQNRKL